MLTPSEVDRIISAFESQPPQDLDILRDWARVLSTQFYWYCAELGKVSKEYRIVRANRKRLFSEMVNQYREQEGSIAAATAKVEASETYSSLYETEAELEGREQAGKRLCDAISKVIDRMNQEIAELRREREYVRHNDGKYNE